MSVAVTDAEPFAPASTPPAAEAPVVERPVVREPIVEPAAEPASAPELPGTLGLVDALLRDHPRLLRRIEAEDRLTELARSLGLIILVCAAIFGAALGFYRGGVQMLFAAIKLPLAVLLTAALSVPAFVAMNAAASGRARAGRDACLVLLALAGASLLISALAPVIVLASFMGITYHSAVLLVVGCCSFGGLFALMIFMRGVAQRAGPARLLISLGLAGVFCAVGAQMTWTLRPFLVRPRTVQVPFVRGIEGSFMESVRMSSDSARGRYIRESAPIPVPR